MIALAMPALEAPGTEWGRLAVLIPGWRSRFDLPQASFYLPDPDQPAWEGWMLRLLESEDISLHSDGNGSPIYLDWWDPKTPMNDPIRFEAPTIGRVCIMVAVHLGRWPGGAK